MPRVISDYPLVYNARDNTREQLQTASSEDIKSL